jgi:hypothetical protein
MLEEISQMREVQWQAARLPLVSGLPSRSPAKAGDQ